MFLFSLKGVSSHFPFPLFVLFQVIADSFPLLRAVSKTVNHGLCTGNMPLFYFFLFILLGRKKLISFCLFQQFLNSVQLYLLTVLLLSPRLKFSAVLSAVAGLCSHLWGSSALQRVRADSSSSTRLNATCAFLLVLLSCHV